MKKKILAATVISVASLAILAGCSSPRMDSASLVPPSAGNAPLAPVQVPAYPPLGYNTNPSVMARPSMPLPPQNVVVGTPAPLPYPQQVAQYQPAPQPRYDPAPRFQREPLTPPRQAENSDFDGNIPNSPILAPNNVIELNVVGMGVAPESTISPAQALALAKRAAIVDGYRQLGEKMYGIRVNGQDTVRDLVLQNSTIKTKVQALIKNAEITETVYKDGLCQVSMELKLDGRVWHRALGLRG
ncbi:LPP20 family lipoprotein [Helicobacter sp. 11S02629-2]|uniref:LPP20 family lipoprotein n=1 Tax=Helicobacter sp. 11S02629-2 TaxID=1476195 RepID=UPI000BA6D65F|nr:LPP20 family lipoprotein [Helicobacter sp. 11S02629-2]PAF42418.1 hypothetical protein BKH40_07880 [Helicobacter sp. 11S02629-2]